MNDQDVLRFLEDHFSGFAGITWVEIDSALRTLRLECVDGGSYLIRLEVETLTEADGRVA